MTQEEFFKRYTYSPSRDRIGGGGFGTLYKAKDNLLHRTVAIKVSEVKTTADGQKTFSLKDEFEALNHVPKHPNIANYEELYSFESPQGVFDYAVMQFYPDGNLSNAIKQGLTIEQKDDIATQLLEGIDFLHKHKVVHRDLKPGNILIVKDGDKIIPLITDFGLSKLADMSDGSMFSNSFGGGTQRYSSPEQLQGNPLHLNTDLWSYGVIVYELFTGKPLFEAGSGAANTAQAEHAIYNKIVRGEVSDLSKIPEKWRNVVERCLVVDPQQRVKDAEALLSLIKGNKEDEDTIVSESVKEMPTNEALSKKNKKFIAMIVAGLLLLFAMIVGYLAWSHTANCYYNKGERFYKDSDYVIALEWYKKAAEKGKAKAQNKVGLMYENGEGVGQDYGEAMRWYMLAAEQNYALAQTNIGNLYDFGTGVEQNYKEALKWYKLAAEQGDARAQYYLGWLYEKGNGVDINYEEAKKWYKLSADQGLARSQYRIGNLYELGNGVEQDYNEAMKWYRMATDNGDDLAPGSIGRLFQYGVGVEQDYEEAKRYYQKAAEKGNEFAMVQLGEIYYCVDKDYDLALEWYKKAADLGYDRGREMMGHYYHDGVAVEPDYEEALRWYRLSADQGNANAQYAIGIMYQFGQEVARNNEEAMRWYQLSAEQGNEKAKERISTININGKDVPKLNDIELTVSKSEQNANIVNENKLEDGTVNGHDYVDLGLPSGTLWAICNIGAGKPEDYGNYYAWGETKTKSTYDWSTYKYADGDGKKLKKYCNESGHGNNGFTDNMTALQTGDDPAASWGSGWRTPTKAQWEELLSNTTNQWTTKNGVKGSQFTSKKNGQKLFLPAAGNLLDSELYGNGLYGEYWSMSLLAISPDYSWNLDFTSDRCRLCSSSRDSGFSVRPVREKRH